MKIIYGINKKEKGRGTKLKPKVVKIYREGTYQYWKWGGGIWCLWQDR